MSDEARLWDVSVSLYPGMVQWVGEELVAAEPLARTPEDTVNVTLLRLTTHSGTHVDAPRHFVHEGATVDDVPLERWVGPCWVADLGGAGRHIGAHALAAAGIPPGVERLLLRAGNSVYWRERPGRFVEEYAGLDSSGARWVVERGIRLVGIDYLSIAPFDDLDEPHQVLLGNGVVIVEGLDLGAIAPGWYELLCFPLKVRSGDGAPARVALRGPLSGAGG